MGRKLLDGLWVAAQPIVDLSTGDVVGYETLIRGGPQSRWPAPAQLFDAARKQGLEAALEARCRVLGIGWGLRHLAPMQTLFLNIDGAHADLPINASALALAPSRIALEISESQNTLDNPECLRQIQRWREQGYRIVVDDYGVGYAGLGLLLTIQPDVVKIDRLLIADIDRHSSRQSVVAHIRELALDQGMTLVAEGIETEGELSVLQQIGIGLGQGYLLGRPQAEPAASQVRLPSKPPVEVPHAGVPSADWDILQKAAEMAYGTPFPAYVVTRARRIVAWNEVAAALTGWSRAQMEQHRCHDQRLNHRDLAGRPLCVGACPLVWTIVKNHAHKQQVIGTAADGSRLEVEVLSSPLWNPTTQQTIGAVEYFWPVKNGAAASPPEAQQTGVGNGRRDVEHPEAVTPGSNKAGDGIQPARSRVRMERW